MRDVYFRFCVFLFAALSMEMTHAQYPPAAGQAGSTAIHKDSSIFVAWATSCEVIRGYQDISNPGLGYASVGDSSMATGPAGTNGVVSLGDGGVATLQFTYPLVNGPSWDFAVFENSFSEYFLELAFVEVSSDGFNFVRFPAHSLTDTTSQVGAFDSLDATKVNNLAGKYMGLYGVPFDLDELKNEAGLDVNHITHIRIIDVVGSLQTMYATFDTAGRMINDPWPTGFASGGFDLDAVGVIWNTSNGSRETTETDEWRFFPNPCNNELTLLYEGADRRNTDIRIFDQAGRLLLTEAWPPGSNRHMLDMKDLAPGLCFLQLFTEGKCVTYKLAIE